MRLGVFLSLMVLLLFMNAGFADVVYKSKSTVTNANNMQLEDIQLNIIPVIETGRGTQPKTINSDKVYVAPVIMPANAQKPSLNVNVENLKNIKKAPLLPNDNINSSLTQYINYYQGGYDNVFMAVVSTIEKSDINLVSFDSQSGRIFCNYKGQKPMFVSVSEYNDKTVMVKVTPADGIYNIPSAEINKIFGGINTTLAKQRTN
ncbi:MAG: hypothetical protein PHX18_05900 [Candidatus Gastranaerophilales bacterium]|nr:hypothetical protein [Candidatus Gastranaerophilales bacterium]